MSFIVFQLKAQTGMCPQHAAFVVLVGFVRHMLTRHCLLLPLPMLPFSSLHSFPHSGVLVRVGRTAGQEAEEAAGWLGRGHELLLDHGAAVQHQGSEGREEGGLAPGLRLPQQGTSEVQVQEGTSLRCKCVSIVRGAYAVFFFFVTCCIIASERASGIVSRVIHILRVPILCLHPCFWMHVLRFSCSLRSFQLQKDRFWAWAQDTPQEEKEEE